MEKRIEGVKKVYEEGAVYLKLRTPFICDHSVDSRDENKKKKCP